MSAALSVATSNSRVSDEARNRNSNAIRMRDQWRRQYAELALNIRHLKRIRDQNPEDFILRTLQGKAIQMMATRAWIRNELVASAYEWV